MLILTKEIIEKLRAKKIFFESSKENFRLSPGNKLFCRKDFSIEPYIGLYSGFFIPRNVGSFSYIWSPLNSNVKVGRYCSIAKNVDCNFANHPYQYVSISTFMYSRTQAMIDEFIKDDSADYDNFNISPQKLHLLLETMYGLELTPKLCQVRY